jgi:hypothetical protein
MSHGPVDFLELAVVNPKIPFFFSLRDVPFKEHLQILDFEDYIHLLFERGASYSC